MLDWLFDEKGFVPRRICGEWTDGLVWVTNASDTVTFLSYLAILVLIAVLAWRRRPAVHRYLFWAFVLFVVSGGAVHLLDVVVFYSPLYRLEAAAKAVTAVASAVTVVLLAAAMPRLLRVRMPEEWDLLARKKADADAKVCALTATLDRRVEERTAELAQTTQQLQMANRVMRDTERKRDEFLAVLAHELRNPLSPILSTVQVLRQMVREVECDRPLGMLERQAKHLARLVDDLLDIQRISRGKITLRREVVSIQEVVRMAVEAMSPVAAEVGVVVESPGLSETAPILAWVDPARLHQVIYNLCMNGIKFNRRGGHVWVTVQASDDEFFLRVRDDGDGVAAELLPEVFKPFVQGVQDRDRAFGGLGVGLALVQSLVEAHGGKVVISSAGPGCGTEVVARLPLTAAKSETKSESGSESGPTPSQPRHTAGRIMVVDDNKDAAESLAMCLRMYGFASVQTAYTGQDALACVGDGCPDVMILDLGLPGMDGYDVGVAVRGKCPGTRIIILSGYGKDEDIRRSKSLGFEHHLVKPVEIDTLVSIIG